MGNFNDKKEVYKHLPEDLLTKVSILLKESGYLTITPTKFSRYDWRRFNEKVKKMGGLWILSEQNSHWRIPWS